MSNNHSATTLIGVKLFWLDNRLLIEGTSIEIPMKEDDPIELVGELGHVLKFYDGGELDERFYYGYVIGYDEGYSRAPNGASLAYIELAMEVAKVGLKSLGYEGEVQMFCFLACY